MIYKIFWVLRAILYKLLFKKVGFPSYLGKPMFIAGFRKITLGKRVRIFPDSRFEAHGNKASIVLEDNISIGPRFHIVAAENITIRRDTLISSDVMITDLDHEYKILNVPVVDQPFVVRKTQIGENCFIGTGAKILAGTTLGKHCIVGANSVVRGDFPDYSVIVGIPAKVVKTFNTKTNSWEKVKGDMV